MKSEWKIMLETVYQISAKARKDKDFEAELASVIEKYMPELFAAEAESPKVSSKKATTKKASGSKKQAEITDAPILSLNPLAYSVEEEGSLREKLMELEIKDLRALIRSYNLDPFKQTSSWKKKDRIVDVMMEAVHQRLIDGAALQRN